MSKVIKSEILLVTYDDINLMNYLTDSVRIMKPSELKQSLTKYDNHYYWLGADNAFCGHGIDYVRLMIYKDSIESFDAVFADYEQYVKPKAPNSIAYEERIASLKAKLQPLREKLL